MDPLDWLVQPRRLFEGRSAAEGCSGEEYFRRACVVHGLALDLDVPAGVVDGIPASDFLSPSARLHVMPGAPTHDDEAGPLGERAPSLYTCSVSADAAGANVQIFCAMIASSSEEVRRRLQARYGCLLADEAQIRLGFDWSEPLANALVSEAMAEVLEIARIDPTSEMAAGLEFQVEQRFVA